MGWGAFSAPTDYSTIGFAVCVAGMRKIWAAGRVNSYGSCKKDSQHGISSGKYVKTKSQEGDRTIVQYSIDRQGTLPFSRNSHILLKPPTETSTTTPLQASLSRLEPHCLPAGAEAAVFLVMYFKR